MIGDSFIEKTRLLCYNNEHAWNEYDDITTLDISREIQLIQLDSDLLDLSGFLPNNNSVFTGSEIIRYMIYDAIIVNIE